MIFTYIRFSRFFIVRIKRDGYHKNRQSLNIVKKTKH